MKMTKISIVKLVINQLVLEYTLQYTYIANALH